MAETEPNETPETQDERRERAVLNLKNILVLAVTDGEVTDEEKSCIDRLRERLGVDQAEFSGLCEAIRSGDRRISISRDSAEGEQMLGMLVELAVADGKVSPPEERTLRKIAAHMEAPSGKLEALIDQALRPPEVDDIAVAAQVEEIYESFAAWDEPTRRAKVAALASPGRHAVKPLVRVLESYRSPDGMPDALALKVLLAEQLGHIGDGRAVYYLTQQVSIGDMEDEITNLALRAAAAEAIGRISGRGFTRDQAGIEAARLWWLGDGLKDYNYLIY